MKYFFSLLMCVALSLFAAMQANAQSAAQVQKIDVLPLVTSNFPPPNADPSAPLPAAPYNITFQLSGRQASCDYVSYVARLQIDFQPGLLGDPQFLDSVSNVRFDFADQLPAGLHVERVHLSGDILAIPATIDQTAGNPANISIAGIQFDPAALTLTQSTLSFEVAIDARIDRTAFAAPSLVDSQATLAISTPFGPYATMQSNDMAYPEDADQLSGQPTSVSVDITGCPQIEQTVGASAGGSTIVSGAGAKGPSSLTVVVTNGAKAPVPPVGGDACFKLIEGEIACSANGAYIYRMPVGPEMAGKTVTFASQTPGVWVDPPSQVVPVGGATLEWTIYGAQPGMTLSFEVTGETSYKGPAEGWGLCCTRLIEIVVPVEDCPEPPPPVLDVVKVPVDCEPGAATCTFRMTVKNQGPGAYTGEIELSDNLTSGSAMLTAAPPAPWQCLSPTTPTVCTHPSTTLQPGESLSLDLTLINLSPELREEALNCARVDLEAFRKLRDNLPPQGTAVLESDCTYWAKSFDPPPPPEDNPPELKITKAATAPVCMPTGECVFEIDITNPGPGTFDDVIVFRDKMNPNVGEFNIDQTKFDCVAAAPDEAVCTSKDVVTLVPGAKQTILAMVRADPASIAAAESFFKTKLTSFANCAAFDDTMSMAESEQSCAEMDLPPEPPADQAKVEPRQPPALVRRPPAGVPSVAEPPAEEPKPKLSIKKTARTAECSAAGECWFDIEIINEGQGDYSGPINFIDYPYGFKNGVRFNDASFDCKLEEPNKGSNSRTQCSSKQNVSLPAGKSISLEVLVIGDAVNIAKAKQSVFGLSEVEGRGPVLRNCAALTLAADIPVGVGDSCAEMVLPPEQVKAAAQPSQLPPPSESADEPTAPVLLQPRQPQENAGDKPDAPVALVPRSPQPVSTDEPSAPVALQPRQPREDLGNEPGAPVALVPRSGTTATPNDCPVTMEMSAEGRCVCPSGSTYDARKRSCTAANAAQLPRVAPPPVAAVPSAKAQQPSTRPTTTAKPQAKSTSKSQAKSNAKPKRQPKPKQKPKVTADDVGNVLKGILQLQQQE